MANPKRRLDGNIPGDFYVDDTCIDCATCRWMAPSTFEAGSDFALVFRQPESPGETEAALQALLACPTGSIGTETKHDLTSARATFPIPVTDNIFHVGYHHRSSFGAASYFIQREGGNVLIDSPRFNRDLVSRIEALGGIRWMFLTHIDDVADHEKFAAHFGCERIMHVDDIRGSTTAVEIQIDGQEDHAIDEELTVIVTPGHTKGSACLNYRERYLFTGDTLAYDPQLGHLKAFNRACWYRWDVLIESMERLATHTFEWVLPGHGRRKHEPDDMPAQMAKCVAWMKQVS